MNGAHGELFTFCLYINNLEKRSKTAQLEPLELGTYQSVNGEAVRPHILLYGNFGKKRIVLRIYYCHENFHIGVPLYDFEEFEAIKAALIDKGGFSEADGVLRKSAPHAAIEQTIENLVTVAKNFYK